MVQPNIYAFFMALGTLGSSSKTERSSPSLPAAFATASIFAISAVGF